MATSFFIRRIRRKSLTALQKERLAGIRREKIEPQTMGLRVIPQLLYGKGHAYAVPFTGTGTEASLSKMTREDLAKWHETWFKPNNATLLIVGDTTLKEITPKLEKIFAGWKPGDVPKKNVAPVAMASKTEVYLIDRPGSGQSLSSAACSRHRATIRTQFQSRSSTMSLVERSAHA